jgi:V/A-type H+-transporting ATPase subunit I
MSIVLLERVTFAGLSADKDRLLDDLHARGCVELIPLRGDAADVASAGPSSEARDALKFLLACPRRRRQVRDDARFDVESVERQTLELQKRVQALESERDALVQRLAAAKPWGDFRFPASEELGEWRLWFYVVPHKDMPKVEALARVCRPFRADDSHGRSDGLEGPSYVWEVVRRDPRFCYVVVVDKTEPQSMPVPRVHLGSRSQEDLDRRLDEVELAIEDAQAERAHLTRWCLLYARDLARLEDAAARAEAAQQTCDRGQLFGLQAWAPQDRVRELAEYAARNGLVFDSQPPTAGESPPTLMRNPPRVAAGEDLVNFYMTPGYWTWDPSGIVFVSFAVFFAMILSDAGYAAVLGLGLLAYWRRLGRSSSGGLSRPSNSNGDGPEGPSYGDQSVGRRFRPLLALIVWSSLIYGVLVGSYFGVAPPRESLLGRLHVLDMSNSKLMMGLSILIGAVHVVLANVMDARRYADWRDGLASVGWAGVVGGGLLFGAGAGIPGLMSLKTIGGGAFLLGLLLVVGFTAWREPPGKRLLQGLLGLTKLSGAFGDVLSYLRLFALGLASASLATAFNDMAAGIRSGVPRVGLFLALLVLAFGHVLNLALGISSCVIHGLRLNVIEFFNWALKDEGRRFTPFRRKEGSLWN